MLKRDVKLQLTNSGTNLDLYRDIGKTCLGGGMHCPSASSSFLYPLLDFRGNGLYSLYVGCLTQYSMNVPLIFSMTLVHFMMMIVCDHILVMADG